MEAILWEILVPVCDNEGNEWGMQHHYKWDKYVTDLCGGLMVLKSFKGKWVNKEGWPYNENMIQCRIACSREDMEKIVDFTSKHYDQECVMAYKISSDVVLKYRTDSE